MEHQTQNVINDEIKQQIQIIGQNFVPIQETVEHELTSAKVVETPADIILIGEDLINVKPNLQHVTPMEAPIENMVIAQENQTPFHEMTPLFEPLGEQLDKSPKIRYQEVSEWVDVTPKPINNIPNVVEQPKQVDNPKVDTKLSFHQHKKMIKKQVDEMKPKSKLEKYKLQAELFGKLIVDTTAQMTHETMAKLG